MINIPKHYKGVLLVDFKIEHSLPPLMKVFSVIIIIIAIKILKLEHILKKIWIILQNLSNLNLKKFLTSKQIAQKNKKSEDKFKPTLKKF